MRDVNVGRRFIADYKSIILKDLYAEIEELAAPLKGRRVLHVNATSFGGGVAEILYTLVPLMNDVGLQAEWQVMTADNDFFNVTKNFHNGLQGAPVRLDAAARELYETVNRRNAERLARHYDFVLIHDPQPCAMRAWAPAGDVGGTHWLWRCHIDTSTPDAGLYEYLLPYIRLYDRAIYTMARYAPADLGVPLEVVPVAIDPLAPKNMTLVPDDARYIVRQFGIDVDRPLLLQVSRFDPWKDPLGVVDAYRTVKASRPEVQLALIGSMASDDPEGWEYLEKLTDYVGGDPDVFVLSNQDNIGSVEVNAFQSPRRRGHPEVDARGVRSHGQRGPLEGAAGGRRRRRRHPAPDRGRRHRVPGRLQRRLRPALPGDPGTAGLGGAASRVRVKNTCAAIS